MTAALRSRSRAKPSMAKASLAAGSSTTAKVKRPPRILANLRSVEADVTTPWLAEIIDIANHTPWRGFVTSIEPFRLIDGERYEALGVKGSVAKHVDREFLPWSYVLILRAGDTVLKCDGHQALKLRPGMLVEFNSHRLHQLRQPNDDVLIWTPLDFEQPIDIADALGVHERNLKDRRSLADASRHRDIIDNVEIATDGTTVWVNGADGGCIGRFSPNASEIHMTAALQIETGRQCLMCTHGKPDYHAWKDFVVTMERIYGVNIPESRRPRWL
jgi:hypothetical protein